MDNPIITNIISTMTNLTLNDNQMETTFINNINSLSLRENKTNELNEVPPDVADIFVLHW